MPEQAFNKWLFFPGFLAERHLTLSFDQKINQ